jgi:flagellar protein FliS
MNAAREKYLQDQVLTATPQKLQLLLIEGAIRFGLQARTLWNENRSAEACEALIRCQEIVAELLANSRQSDSEIGRRAALEYLFVFQRLVASSLSMGGQPLADALRVLAEERETWRMVCEQLGAEHNPAGPSAPPAPHWKSRGAATPGGAETGISFQA